MDTADLVYMCRTVAQDHRWSDTDNNSDTDSVAVLEHSAWDDACAGEFQNTLGNVPPGLIQNPPTDIIRNYETDDNSDTDSVAEWEDYTGDDTCACECRIALLRLSQNPPTDILYPKLMNCRQRKTWIACHTRCVMIVYVSCL